MSSPESNGPNMGHRHSLTIESTNPLHLLPSNSAIIHRRFSTTTDTAPLTNVQAIIERLPSHLRKEIFNVTDSFCLHLVAHSFLLLAFTANPKNKRNTKNVCVDKLIQNEKTRSEVLRTHFEMNKASQDEEEEKKNEGAQPSTS